MMKMPTTSSSRRSWHSDPAASQRRLTILISGHRGASVPRWLSLWRRGHWPCLQGRGLKDFENCWKRAGQTASERLEWMHLEPRQTVRNVAVSGKLLTRRWCSRQVRNGTNRCFSYWVDRLERMEDRGNRPIHETRRVSNTGQSHPCLPYMPEPKGGMEFTRKSDAPKAGKT